jgi:hypothetical protein
MFSYRATHKNKLSFLRHFIVQSLELNWCGIYLFHFVMDFGRTTTLLPPLRGGGDASETTLKENDDDDDNTTIMEFTTNEDTDAQTLNQDTVKKEADNKESEKNEKNDPSQQLLRNDIIHSSSSSNIIQMTNDMMMMPPPSKLQELAASAVVEPTKCIEPTNEEMKESKGERATAVVEENEERESAPEKCTDDLGSAVQQQQLPAPRLCRPIQKARTAYFIFADEKRAEIAARVSTNSLACHFGMEHHGRCHSHTIIIITVAPGRRSGCRRTRDWSNVGCPDGTRKGSLLSTIGTRKGTRGCRAGRSVQQQLLARRFGGLDDDNKKSRHGAFIIISAASVGSDSQNLQTGSGRQGYIQGSLVAHYQIGRGLYETVGKRNGPSGGPAKSTQALAARPCVCLLGTGTIRIPKGRCARLATRNAPSTTTTGTFGQDNQTTQE